MSKPEFPGLAPTEWEVMKVLWDSGPAAARDVYSELPDDCDWAYKTVKTLLSRLVAKGAVEYDQVGNSYLYRAAIDRSDATRQEVQGVMTRLVSSAASPVLAHFIEQSELSDAEIQALQKQLDKKKKGRKRGKS